MVKGTEGDGLRGAPWWVGLEPSIRAERLTFEWGIDCPWMAVVGRQRDDGGL